LVSWEDCLVDEYHLPPGPGQDDGGGGAGRPAPHDHDVDHESDFTSRRPTTTVPAAATKASNARPLGTWRQTVAMARASTPSASIPASNQPRTGASFCRAKSVPMPMARSRPPVDRARNRLTVWSCANPSPGHNRKASPG